LKLGRYVTCTSFTLHSGRLPSRHGHEHVPLVGWLLGGWLLGGWLLAGGGGGGEGGAGGGGRREKVEDKVEEVVGSRKVVEGEEWRGRRRTWRRWRGWRRRWRWMEEEEKVEEGVVVEEEVGEEEVEVEEEKVEEEEEVEQVVEEEGEEKVEEVEEEGGVEEEEGVVEGRKVEEEEEEEVVEGEGEVEEEEAKYLKKQQMYTAEMSKGPSQPGTPLWEFCFVLVVKLPTPFILNSKSKLKSRPSPSINSLRMMESMSHSKLPLNMSRSRSEGKRSWQLPPPTVPLRKMEESICMVDEPFPPSGENSCCCCCCLACVRALTSLARLLTLRSALWWWWWLLLVPPPAVWPPEEPPPAAVAVVPPKVIMGSLRSSRLLRELWDRTAAALAWDMSGSDWVIMTSLGLWPSELSSSCSVCRPKREMLEKDVCLFSWMPLVPPLAPPPLAGAAEAGEEAGEGELSPLGLDTKLNPGEPLPPGAGPGASVTRSSSSSSIRSSPRPSFRFMVSARTASRGSSGAGGTVLPLVLPGDRALPGGE
ncbi:hypothetical protein CRUP_014676, partial [Coryphaenoides rupestris]